MISINKHFFIYLKWCLLYLYQGTSDESHWLYLNKSLYRVSSMTNGKVDAIREIEVIYYCSLLMMSGLSDKTVNRSVKINHCLIESPPKKEERRKGNIA